MLGPTAPVSDKVHHWQKQGYRHCCWEIYSSLALEILVRDDDDDDGDDGGGVYNDHRDRDIVITITEIGTPASTYYSKVV